MPGKAADRFQPGDLVFAKMRGFPHWPARIASGEGSKKKVPVFFYGTHQTASIPTENIVTYLGNKGRYGKGVRIRGFTEGMWEIENTPRVGSKQKMSTSPKQAPIKAPKTQAKTVAVAAPGNKKPSADGQQKTDTPINTRAEKRKKIGMHSSQDEPVQGQKTAPASPAVIPPASRKTRSAEEKTSSAPKSEREKTTEERTKQQEESSGRKRKKEGEKIKEVGVEEGKAAVRKTREVASLETDKVIHKEEVKKGNEEEEGGVAVKGNEEEEGGVAVKGNEEEAENSPGQDEERRRRLAARRESVLKSLQGLLTRRKGLRKQSLKPTRTPKNGAGGKKAEEKKSIKTGGHKRDRKTASKKKESKKPEEQNECKTTDSKKPDEQKECKTTGGKKTEEQKEGKTTGGKKPEEQKEGKTTGGKKPEEQKEGKTTGGKKPEEQKEGKTTGGKKPEEQKEGKTTGGKKPEEQKEGKTTGGKKPEEQTEGKTTDEKVERTKTEVKKLEGKKTESKKPEEKMEKKVERQKSVEAKKSELTRAEATRSEATRAEATRSAATRAEATRSAATRAEATRSAATRAEAERSAATRAEAERSEAKKVEKEKVERQQEEEPKSPQRGVLGDGQKTDSVAKLNTTKESLTDSTLHRIHGDIRISLKTDNPDISKCLIALDQLSMVYVTSQHVQRHSELITTLRKMRRFRSNQDVMDKASMLYNRFKNAFLTVNDKDNVISPEFLRSLLEEKEREEEERVERWREKQRRRGEVLQEVRRRMSQLEERRGGEKGVVTEKEQGLPEGLPEDGSSKRIILRSTGRTEQGEVAPRH